MSGVHGTAPQKRSATPGPPALPTDIRHTEYTDTVLLVENDPAYTGAWIEVDLEHAHCPEDMA